MDESQTLGESCIDCFEMKRYQNIQNIVEA